MGSQERTDWTVMLFLGLALMGGVTLVIFALVQSPRWGWADARTGECLAAGALLIAFLFFQRSFITGITAGALKS